MTATLPVKPKARSISRPDFMLGTRDGWDAFQVVRWHGVEQLSKPFRFEVTVVRDAAKGPADLDALVDTSATLRIRCDGGRRLVHGVIESIQEVERTRLLFA
jgi:type VI secretion system secreted protein VgrG